MEHFVKKMLLFVGNFYGLKRLTFMCFSNKVKINLQKLNLRSVIMKIEDEKLEYWAQVVAPRFTFYVSLLAIIISIVAILNVLVGCSKEYEDPRFVENGVIIKTPSREISLQFDENYVCMDTINYTKTDGREYRYNIGSNLFVSDQIGPSFKLTDRFLKEVTDSISANGQYPSITTTTTIGKMWKLKKGMFLRDIKYFVSIGQIDSIAYAVN